MSIVTHLLLISEPSPDRSVKYKQNKGDSKVYNWNQDTTKPSACHHASCWFVSFPLVSTRKTRHRLGKAIIREPSHQTTQANRQSAWEKECETDTESDDYFWQTLWRGCKVLFAPFWSLPWLSRDRLGEMALMIVFIKSPLSHFSMAEIWIRASRQWLSIVVHHAFKRTILKLVPFSSWKCAHSSIIGPSVVMENTGIDMSLSNWSGRLRVRDMRAWYSERLLKIWSAPEPPTAAWFWAWKRFPPVAPDFVSAIKNGKCRPELLWYGSLMSSALSCNFKRKSAASLHILGFKAS